MKFISLSAVDVNQLALKLNAMIEEGYTISTVSLSVDKVAYALVYAKEPQKWQKSGAIYLDGKNEKQSADTFNGTLLYVVIMLLLTIFNDRIIGWIGAPVFYLIWKSSKYN